MQSLSMLQRWKVCEHVRLRHAKSKMRHFHFREEKENANGNISAGRVSRKEISPGRFFSNKPSFLLASSRMF